MNSVEYENYNVITSGGASLRRLSVYRWLTHEHIDSVPSTYVWSGIVHICCLFDMGMMDIDRFFHDNGVSLHTVKTFR